jgi:hypothetical protein
MTTKSHVSAERDPELVTALSDLLAQYRARLTTTESERGLMNEMEQRLLGLVDEALRTRGAMEEDITHLYRGILGREPEPQAFLEYRAKSILAAASAIAQSEEACERSRGARDVDVARIYRELFGRDPESPQVLSGNRGRPILDVALTAAKSLEFRERARRATDEDVVRLYQELLGRPPESAEVIAGYRGYSLLDIAIGIAKSEESRLRAAEEVSLGAASVRRLHGIFFPEAPAPDEWYVQFSQIVRAHRLTSLDIARYFYALSMHRRGVEIERSYVSQSVERPATRLKNFGSKVTLVIPTCNSERWIGQVLDFYTMLEVPVVVAVDRRSSDRTLTIVASKAKNHLLVESEHPRVESLLPSIVGQIDSDWILRLDDDELPTPALLSFVDQAVDGPAGFSWGFPRAHFRYQPNGSLLQYSRFLPLGPLAGSDVQWRLFPKRQIRFDDSLHTPGIVAAEARQASSEAFIFHFDWVVRTLADRLEKIERYVRQDGKRARELAHICLYDKVPDSWHMFSTLDNEQYRLFAEEVFRARRTQVGSPPLACHGPADSSASPLPTSDGP